MHTPTRTEALALFREYNESDSLLKHALAVEGVMRFMARKLGHDEEMWGIVGLVHDIDYERYPGEHPRRSREILGARNWPAEYIHAVLSHAWGICSDVEPQHEMENVLYAIDELTGLVTAVTLVRPSKSLIDVTPKSVMKKWKDRGFAAGADRDIIRKGAERLGWELNDLIADVIAGMQDVAAELGLDGSQAAGQEIT